MAGLGRVRLAAVLATVLVAGAATFAPSSAGAQLPSSSTVLPGRMDTMVVDAATLHVFVSMYDTGKVVVLDFDGKIVATISGEAGARGLVVVGNHLYVAAMGSSNIDEIDTATLTRSRTLASGIAATDLAFAGGALWANSGPDGLTRVSLLDGAKQSYTGPLGGHLVADPADADLLVDYTGFGTISITVFDVSTDPPTVVVSKIMNAPVVEQLHDVSVSPDGAHLTLAAFRPTDIEEFNASDLQPSGVVYPAPAVYGWESLDTTAAAGGLLAAFRDDGGVVVYRLDDPSAPIATHYFGARTAGPRGLRFSPDGARLFAITEGAGFNDAFNTIAISGRPPPVTALKVTPNALVFGGQRVGTYGRGQRITIANTGNVPLTVNSLTLSGANAVDFFGSTNCFPTGHPGSLAAGASCYVTMYFGALKLGFRAASLAVATSAPNSPRLVALNGDGTEGYFIAGARGEVGEFGDAVYHGDATDVHLTAPIVSLATTVNGAGYWLLGRDGGIFSFGNAAFYGSTGGIHLNKPVVGMTSTRTGRGYWLVASDGGIFSFGDARFYGSTGAIHLNKPIVGMAATPSGRGYWLVASDGGIFSFGDAEFHGSTGATHLARPINAMTTSPTGRGYMLVASDGGAFMFGDARFYGSAARTGATIVGAAPTPEGRGYWIASNRGDIFHYGDAPTYGNIRNLDVTDVIGIAATAPPLPPELLGRGAAGGGNPTMIAAAGSPMRDPGRQALAGR